MMMNRRTVLKGGIVLAATAHTAALAPEIAAAPVVDRKREMLESLRHVEEFLFEETGIRWMLYASGGQAGMIVAIDSDNQSLHDPMGIFGKRLRHGEPILTENFGGATDD